MFFKRLKSSIYSFFREFLVFHHSSLEFRAKLLSAVIAAKSKNLECEDKILWDIAKKIYKNDEIRAEVLVKTVYEYIDKIREMNDLGVDELILDIDKTLKKHPKFYKKIDIDMLKRFLKCKASTEEKLLRWRVIEFLQSELKEFSTKSKKNEKK